MGVGLYVSAKNYEEISDCLINREKYINVNELEDIDVILKIDVIHFQFESIDIFIDVNFHDRKR